MRLGSPKKSLVIFHPALFQQRDIFCGFITTDDAADVGVKLPSHACVNQRTTVLSSEDNMIFEARIGRHAGSLRK